MKDYPIQKMSTVHVCCIGRPQLTQGVGAVKKWDLEHSGDQQSLSNPILRRVVVAGWGRKQGCSSSREDGKGHVKTLFISLPWIPNTSCEAEVTGNNASWYLDLVPLCKQ